ncbi:MAG: HdeD family acid-resistance protein [Pigmentiphaga sp.]|uniref:HdeD family acid-resistance protein n=1 Tax=Pigmentiphaga sp. TaxID=1977564 RepID=UPI0029B2429C|nr:HdeD family acid-resistance protein [Pigmentiphaga sp.]MDX3905520.1 HdeD family acid-resistance protein [Pigmentiphaga sp.]
MVRTPNTPAAPGGLSWPETLKALGAHWGWFVGLGILLLLLGLAAGIYVIAATVASVLFVGVMMLVAGIGQLIQAWRVKNWRGFLLWTLSGVLYGVAGGLALYNPIAGAAVLTLLLGAFLIAAGALRLWIWFQHRSQHGWGWLALSGAITLLAGVLIAIGWPANSLWILGLLLAFDLLFQGITLVLLGLALRKGRPIAPSPRRA